MSQSFCDKLVHLRKRMGLSQRELARLVGIAAPTLHAFEHGDRNPSMMAVATAQKLARVFGVTLDYLTGMYDEEIPSALEPATADLVAP